MSAGSPVDHPAIPAPGAPTAAQRVWPDWPAPPRIRAFATTRAGGVSTGSLASLNLGDRSDDAPDRVAENRRRFRALLPSEPGWLRQVHGARVVRREDIEAIPGVRVDADSATGTARQAAPEADGVWTARPGLACTILAADCLPVLFCDREGTVVAAAHAGWRGLAGGVLEATVAALPVAPERLLAWIGPGIGVDAYEVGDDFRDEFRSRLPWLASGFERRNGRVHADLAAIARAVLRRAGVGAVHGGGFCTYTDRARFFSHRRDPASGRQAAVIWLEAEA